MHRQDNIDAGSAMNPKSSFCFALLVISLVAMSTGCPTVRHPWAGQPYSPPTVDHAEGQTTYSPRPRLLAPRVMEELDTEAADREIEQLIFGIDAGDAEDQDRADH